MKTRLIILFLLPLALCACRGNACAVSETFADTVNAELKKAVPFWLDGFTPFAWDNLYVFRPYTPVKIAARRVGATDRDLSGTAIELSDAISLLVFVKDGRIVKCMDFPRKYGDFSSVATDTGISRSSRVLGHVSPDGRVLVALEE